MERIVRSMMSDAFKQTVMTVNFTVKLEKGKPYIIKRGHPVSDRMDKVCIKKRINPLAIDIQ